MRRDQDARHGRRYLEMPGHQNDRRGQRPSRASSWGYGDDFEGDQEPREGFGGYEPGYDRPIRQHHGPQDERAADGYMRPGDYDYPFERGAYRRDEAGSYDRNNDLRNDWGSRGYDHEAAGRDRIQRPGAYGHNEGPHVGRGPEGYTRSPERIQEDVCERLTHHGYLDASHIRVRVEKDEVTLEGQVDSRRAKRLAEDLAEHVRGVRDVHNRLRINENLSHNPRPKAVPGQSAADPDVAPTAAAEPREEQVLTETRGGDEKTHRRPARNGS